MKVLEAYQKGFNEGFAKAKSIYEKTIDEKTTNNLIVEERILRVYENNIVNGYELMTFLGLKMSHRRMKYRYNTELWSQSFWEIVDMGDGYLVRSLIDQLSRGGYDPVYPDWYERKDVPTYELAKRFKKSAHELYKVFQEKGILERDYQLTEKGSLYGALVDCNMKNINLQKAGITYSYMWSRRVIEAM